VRKGQRLFTIHSPELVVAEHEYLLAKQNEKELAQSTVPGVAAGVGHGRQQLVATQGLGQDPPRSELLRAVEEVDAGRERLVEDRERRGLVRLHAEGHRAQAQGGNPDSGAA